MSDLQQKQRDYLNTPEGLDEVLRHFGACGVTRPGKPGFDEAHQYWKDIIKLMQIVRQGDDIWLIELGDTLRQMTSDYGRTVLGAQIITDRSGGDE